MQLLTEYSEEGNVDGLGWFNGETKSFQFDEKDEFHKIPHLGWNTLSTKTEHPILDRLNPEDSFYFAHSYYVDNISDNFIIAETEYGIRFTSVINKGNLFGVQFHPEKSHDAGLKILENFVENC